MIGRLCEPASRLLPFATETITTDIAYSAAPYLGIVADWACGAWYQSAAAAQNANGTWDIEITVANAPAPGPAGTVNVNTKGSCADTTDLDP